MTGPIRIAIFGVGNCASSLLQGIEYYKHNVSSDEDAIGLMHYDLGGYKPGDIEVVAAFDVDARKVGKKINEAIFAPPNCTKTIWPDMPDTDVVVNMGWISDGVSEHMLAMTDLPQERRFLPAQKDPDDVVAILKESGAQIALNYLPVGSEKASRQYAQACLDAGVAFINCIPVFIVSTQEWGEKFKAAGLPCVGDDVKAQVGATITHRTLMQLFKDRGAKITATYQLNTGGNTDFLNMLNESRLVSKRISKTEAVQSILDEPLPAEQVHIGPSDYVPWQNDNKVCFLRIEGLGFGGVPLHLELRLSVEDSPNSGGVTIDAIRCCKLALDRGIAGPITSIAAYTMKHPPQQIPDAQAREMVEEFIQGKRER